MFKNHCPLSVSSATMAFGSKKHLKQVPAPKHWMLHKMTSVFAPSPSTRPHKLRECLLLTKEQTKVCHNRRLSKENLHAAVC